MITYSAAEIAISVAYAQTVVPIPKHTFAYETGAKKGLAAAKAGVYDVGPASFSGNDLEHCIAGFYGAVAGYHDTVLAANTISKYHNGTNK